MPAWVEAERSLGMKWITYYPGNAARGLADSTGIIVLNDADTGMPVAVMEGMWITYARTSACAAVAARHLARAGATRLGLIGCGGLGTWSLRMLFEVFPDIREVRVSSRGRESREAFCRTMAAEVAWRLIPASGNEEVVRQSDIVISSISKSETPQALEAWWPAGSLAIPLDVAGCWDSAAFAKADRLVSDGYESLVRAANRARPDLRLSEDRHVRLEDVVAGRVKGRLSPADRIMAVPTGVASVDMTLAWEIFRCARKAGLGKHVRLT
jgi:ornithine cyclodeaminase/alanine dehydrogenase-like protein (mu-crystallin family)